MFSTCLEPKMYIGKPLFSQLIDFLPWKTFHRIVERYDGDHRVLTRVISAEESNGGRSPMIASLPNAAACPGRSRPSITSPPATRVRNGSVVNNGVIKDGDAGFLSALRDGSTTVAETFVEETAFVTRENPLQSANDTPCFSV